MAYLFAVSKSHQSYFSRGRHLYSSSPYTRFSYTSANIKYGCKILVKPDSNFFEEEVKKPLKGGAPCTVSRNSLPLHVEVCYNDYDVIGAFASASILAGLAIVTLILKTALEWKQTSK